MFVFTFIRRNVSRSPVVSYPTSFSSFSSHLLFLFPRLLFQPAVTPGGYEFCLLPLSLPRLYSTFFSHVSSSSLLSSRPLSLIFRSLCTDISYSHLVFNMTSEIKIYNFNCGILSLPRSPMWPTMFFSSTSLSYSTTVLTSSFTYPQHFIIEEGTFVY